MHGDQSSRTDPNDANVRALARAQLERLNSDLRVLSPLGIERAAWGWDRHAPDSSDAFRAAERAAIHAIENSAEAEHWHESRRRPVHEVEGQLAFMAWRRAHRNHAQA